VKDKKLAFRVLIASNLAATLATQLRTQPERRAAERARLRALLGRDDGDVPELNAALAAKLRAGGLAADELRRITAAVQESLRDALAVVNPSFDTSLETE